MEKITDGQHICPSIRARTMTDHPAAYLLVSSVRRSRIRFENERELQLKEMLGNDDNFYIFMGHLSKEFSIKYLLAFIEIIQLQENELSRQQFQGFLFWSIVFYKDIPKSFIVYNDRGLR